MLFKEVIQHASNEFRKCTRKTAHTNVITRKYVIINRNKYIYSFWMTGFRFSFSAVQLHMGIIAMIIWQRRSQLQKNKEMILHLKKKKGIATSCWVKQGRTLHAPCVLNILTLSYNKSSVQIFQRFV